MLGRNRWVLRLDVRRQRWALSWHRLIHARDLFLIRSACRVDLAFSLDQCGGNGLRTLLSAYHRSRPSWRFRCRSCGGYGRDGGLSHLGRNRRGRHLRMQLGGRHGALRWGRDCLPRGLDRPEAGGLMPRHERRDRLRAVRDGGDRMHNGRQRSGQMGACRNCGFEGAAAGHCAGGRHHRDRARVVDVRDIGDVRRLVRHVLDGRVLHAHADVGHRRRADDHRGWSSHGCRHDQAESRAGRCGNEYALRSNGREPGHHACYCGRNHQAKARRRRNERDARRRPMAGDENHQSIAMLVVRLYPCIAWFGRRGPTSRGPYPVALPCPIATSPDRTREGRRRRSLHQHGRRRPCHRNRRGLIQRRIDIHADDTRSNGCDRHGLNRGMGHQRWLHDTARGQECQGHCRNFDNGE